MDFSTPVKGISRIANIATTSGGTLDVDFSTVPEQIKPGEEIKMNINFINPQTQKTQIHIDYFVTVLEGENEVFGPTDRIHTSEGKVSIPIQFQREGEYKVKIDINGILFNAIPSETVSFTIFVGDVNPKPNTTETTDVLLQRPHLVQNYPTRFKC